MSEIKKPTATTWVNGKVYGLVAKQPLKSITYGKESCYRGVTSTGQVLYVLADVLEANRDTFAESEIFGDVFNADEWLPSVDEENCWLAARCEACGVEFRPIDGYHEPDEYSYCADCCHW